MKKIYTVCLVLMLCWDLTQASQDQLCTLCVQESFARLGLKREKNFQFFEILNQRWSELVTFFEKKDKKIIFEELLHQGYDHDQKIAEDDPILTEYKELDLLYPGNAERVLDQQDLFQIEEDEFVVAVGVPFEEL